MRSCQRLTGAIQQRLHQRGMAVERRSDVHFDIAVSARGTRRKARQVALHVSPERQEIGDDDDAPGAARDEQRGGAAEIGLAQFQERGLDHVLAGGSHLGGDIAHGLIGAFDARAVGEDDEPGHTWINGDAGAALRSVCGK